MTLDTAYLNPTLHPLVMQPKPPEELLQALVIHSGVLVAWREEPADQLGGYSVLLATDRFHARILRLPRERGGRNLYMAWGRSGINERIIEAWLELEVRAACCTKMAAVGGK